MPPEDPGPRRGAQHPSVHTGPRRSPRTVLVTAVAAVVAAVLGFAVVTQLARTGRVEGDASRFVVGDAAALAGPVDRDGPLLFQDVSNGRRDVFVHHLGDGRWVAFEAYPRGSPRSCQLRWQPADGTFLDPCDGTTYPADGTGLVRYPATVDAGGQLVIDLRAPAPPTTGPPTTGPPTTGPPTTGPPTTGPPTTGP